MRRREAGGQSGNGWRVVVSCGCVNWKHVGKHCCAVTEQDKVIRQGPLEEEFGLEDELLLWMTLTPIFKGFSLQGPPKSSHYLSPYSAV